MNSRESQEEKFHALYQKAKKIRQTGHYHDARKQYMHMLNNFSINQVDYTDYICVMADLGDIQKHLNKFEDSKKTYLKAIAYLNEAKHSQKVSQYEIQKEKYHLYSNLGLLLCSEAQRIEDKNANYESFRKIIDQCMSYYRTCEQIAIVVDMLVEKDKIEGEDQTITWWRNQYIGLIINMLNPLETEAFSFKDKQAIILMVKLIERAEHFYSLCSKKTQSDLETNLSKCYYFKALCLMFLGKKSESEKYFKKDFAYCQKHNQKEDLQKTRVQIIKFYMANFQFTEARQYTKNAAYLAEINEAEKQYFDLMRKLRNMETDFDKGIEVSNDDLENLLFELNDKKCNKKAFEFNKKARNTPQFKQNEQFRYWLEYYASQTCFKLQLYNDSLKFIKQAFQLAKRQPVETTWCLLQKAIIMDKIQNDRKKVYDIFLNCIQISKICGDQNCKQQCATQFEEFKMRQKRRNRDFKLDDKCSKKLFDYLDKKQKRKEQMRHEETVQVEQVSNPISEDEETYQPQVKLVKASNPMSNPMSRYIENCRIFGIQPLEKFKQILRENQQINLASMIYFPTQQVLALVISAAFVQNLDLRNFILTPQLLREIRSSETPPNIKLLKLNMINASIHVKKDEVFDQLSELLSRVPLLQNFTISNLYKMKQIQVLIDANYSGAFQGLKVLKLKECQIQDKDLQLLMLGEKLPQLKKLSLSGNKLEGKTIQTLISLKELEQLSLSQNPLCSMSQTRSFQSLRKVSLKNLSNAIPQQRYPNFIPLIMNCQTINMKGASYESLEILNVLVKYVIEIETELSNLKGLKLFGSRLNGKDLINLLWNLERRAPNLKLIDLRCCQFIDADENLKILEEIGNFGDIFMRGKFNHVRIEEENPEQMRSFKFQNSKTVKSDDREPTKNFNIS